ncbi:MAG: methylated-DNA--[protein]-cysteine S-methyltransferase, partial [Sediminibacterium sp.]|nr:methylated-DNA--[protein]-cysteine S-methyltransferase [Sediminibacterium sp.]
MDIITYAYYDSPVGVLKIGGTEQYITEISFAAKETEPAHNNTEPTPLLHACTEQLIEYFLGTRQVFDIPYHQSGTEFQEKVWAKLAEINYGNTYSYSDIAKKLGDPKVIRAAASANGKNKLMILVPCHRVIGADRSLVGYAGGMAV